MEGLGQVNNLSCKDSLKTIMDLACVFIVCVFLASVQLKLVSCSMAFVFLAFFHSSFKALLVCYFPALCLSIVYVFLAFVLLRMSF